MKTLRQLTLKQVLKEALKQEAIYIEVSYEVYYIWSIIGPTLFYFLQDDI